MSYIQVTKDENLNDMSYTSIRTERRRNENFFRKKQAKENRKLSIGNFEDNILDISSCRRNEHKNNVSRNLYALINLMTTNCTE